MKIRITPSVDDNVTTILVEGRLTAEAVPHLQTEFESARGPTVLDLSGLTAADTEGVRAIQRLASEGVTLSNPSAYIRQLLNLATSDVAADQPPPDEA